MRLYANSCATFIEDCQTNQISEKLKTNFEDYFGYPPSPGEKKSWQNSLRALAMVLVRAGLTEQGVLLEYQLPMTSKRADCIICGYDQGGKPAVVVVELKQWEMCKATEGVNEVLTFVGGAEREVLHPSEQSRRYAEYLSDTHEECNSENAPIEVHACSYLHNYFEFSPDPLQSDKFSDLLIRAPLFTGDHVEQFSAFLKERIGHHDGLEVLARIEQSSYRPSKKLMEHVVSVIGNVPQYLLLDEQQVAFDAVLTAAKSMVHKRKKQILLIKGGPGTGKSVLAVNLVAALLSNNFATHYVTGSKAFTETLRKIIGARGSDLFTYSNNYMQAAIDSVDVLVTDEAHRIRDVSSNHFTPRDKRSDLKQIEELINAARVCVFLIDDDQIVRPGEIGSASYIREYAAKLDCELVEFELDAQFRCNGSDSFVKWISRTIGINETGPEHWRLKEEFDFRIFDSPESLEVAIKDCVAAGHSGRVMAGFCWPWSDPKSDGTLVNDVTIGSFSRPWNAKPEAGRLASGIPKSSLWAYQETGINQIGCVYTAQGFEFDYAGVIVGEDLRYDSVQGNWIADKAKSEDKTVRRSKDDFLRFVKNTYRVLLSRGMKGCYVHFVDADTAAYFRSKIEP